MKRYLIITVLVLTALSTALNAGEPELKKIFNGKNFQNWKEPKANIWWSIKDDILTVKNGPKKRGSILWTTKDYTDFIIKLDFKFGKGNIDSGIFLRSENQQIQIGTSGSLKRDITGSMYIPGKGYPLEAEGVKELLKLEDWNTMKIKAVGSVYTVWLNGKQIVHQDQPLKAVKKGPIGIQLHPKREMHVDFRNISLAEL